MGFPALGVTLLLLLAACASTTPFESRLGQLRWENRKSDLETIQAWNVSGRVALSTEFEAWNGTLVWRQDSQAYRLRFIAPLGQGTLQLEGNGEGVVLRSTQHPEPLMATSAEALLRQQFGWQLPLHHLRYWVLGIPDPSAEADWDVDIDGRITLLQQSHWQIKYLRYQTVQGRQMPEKIFIEHDQFKLRMIVQAWTIAQSTD